jgi:hypothetical protein
VARIVDSHVRAPEDRRMKKSGIILLLLVLGGVGTRLLSRDQPEAKLIFDRFWVDHEPRDNNDRFQVLFVASEEPFGRFVTRVIWTGQWEAFHYHVVPREDGVLDLLFGATGERQRVRYTARRCNEKGFDFCLDITGSSRGVQRYYSKKQWGSKTGELDGLLQPAQ